MILHCHFRQVMIRFAWILFVALPFGAGLYAGSQRRPGLVGLRDALRADWPRDGQHVGIMTNGYDDHDETAEDDPLRCFEVHHPVLLPSGLEVDERPVAAHSSMAFDRGATSCDLVLMEHSFANSYGNPFTGGSHAHDCPKFENPHFLSALLI